MKKAEFKQIKGLPVLELVEKASNLRKEISDLTIDKNMKKLKDIKTIFKKRKDRAKVLTVLRQKQLLGELEARIKQEKKKGGKQIKRIVDDLAGSAQ